MIKFNPLQYLDKKLSNIALTYNLADFEQRLFFRHKKGRRYLHKTN